VLGKQHGEALVRHLFEVVLLAELGDEQQPLGHLVEVALVGRGLAHALELGAGLLPVLQLARLCVFLRARARTRADIRRARRGGAAPARGTQGPTLARFFSARSSMRIFCSSNALSLSLSWLFFFAPGRPGANDILAPGPAAAPRPPHWHWAFSQAHQVTGTGK